MHDTPMFLDHHPLLGHGGLWAAEGWYFDESHHMVPAKGWTKVSRARDAWTLTSELRLDLLGPHAIAYRSVMTFDPPRAQAREAYWSSESPALGAFAGRLTALADTLMIVGFSEDGLYQIIETYILGDTEPDEGPTYHIRGTLARESETVGAWTLTATAEHLGGG